jgi:hypothetical protein
MKKGGQMQDNDLVNLENRIVSYPNVIMFYNEFLRYLYTWEIVGSDLKALWNENFEWFKVPQIYFRIYAIWKHYELIIADETEQTTLSYWFQVANDLMNQILDTNGFLRNFKALPKIPNNF